MVLQGEPQPPPPHPCTPTPQPGRDAPLRFSTSCPGLLFPSSPAVLWGVGGWEDSPGRVWGIFIHEPGGGQPRSLSEDCSLLSLQR